MMKETILILGLMAVSCAGLAGAGSYTIANEDGKEIAVTEVSYDGEYLKARRVIDGQRFRIRSNALDPDSWQRLNSKLTETMRVGLDVRSIATSRKTTTHWKTDYGSSETTTTSIRKFNVRVTSTSHFSKPCRVVSYWISGDKAQAEKHEVWVSRNQPYEVVVGGSASLYALNLVAIGEYYSRGSSTDTDVVVVVEHANGSISELYATTQSAEDLIRAQYDRDG